MNKTVKRIIIGSILFIVFAIIGCVSTDRIGVGEVGVKVKLAGTNRGVQDMQIKTGWVLFNPLTEEVISFPTAIENIVWTKDPHEGVKKDEKTNLALDESITFASKEGVNVNADIGFSFHVQPDMANILYAKFKQNNMQDLAYGYMRNVVRDAFNEEGSQLAIQEIYGAGKNEMIRKVIAHCRAELGKDGIIVDQLTINGALRLPENVINAINNAIAATQRATEAENKVRQISAEAEQAIAKAKGEAESARQAAQGAADALLIRTKAENDARVSQAQSQTEANKMLSNSLTPQIIQYKSLDTWNGVLPTYYGSGALPMISIK